MNSQCRILKNFDTQGIVFIKGQVIDYKYMTADGNFLLDIPTRPRTYLEIVEGEEAECVRHVTNPGCLALDLNLKPDELLATLGETRLQLKEAIEVLHDIHRRKSGWGLKASTFLRKVGRIPK